MPHFPSTFPQTITCFPYFQPKKNQSNIMQKLCRILVFYNFCVISQNLSRIFNHTDICFPLIVLSFSWLNIYTISLLVLSLNCIYFTPQKVEYAGSLYKSFVYFSFKKLTLVFDVTFFFVLFLLVFFAFGVKIFRSVLCDLGKRYN